MIYQLMKTTPYLGGQIRIDLVSDNISGDSSLYLDEVHVVPITDRVWYSGSDNQLNNHHTDNIAELYKKTQDTFYECIGDSMLEGKYPYYSSDGNIVDTVDHTYQMGLRRNSVSRYGKEMSFLLPMWIDSEDYIDDLDFFVNVEAITTDHSGEQMRNTITSKKFEMSDRLRSYLKEYLKGVSSDLMYVGIRDNSAYITGLDVSSGTVLTKDISTMVKYLTYRERPILETDNILVGQFYENKMVARQLMNFNLFFSMKDIFALVVEPSLRWCEMNVWCEAKLKDRVTGRYSEIPVRDIYSNYTNIFSYKIDSNPLKSGKFVESFTRGDKTWDFNVLDYLNDYNDIDSIHSNKILQPTFHWSFTDNSKYTWNLYNGFSPLVYQDGEVSRVEGRFFGTPDVFTTEYSMHSNNIQWITVLDGTSSVVPGSFVGLSMNPGSTSRFSPNDYGNCWVRGIKYVIGDTLRAGVKYTDGQGEQQTLVSNGIYANISAINDVSVDYLKPGRIYCAVLRKTNSDGNLYDYVSMVYLLDTDIKEYRLKDLMTHLGVRKILDGRIGLADDTETEDVFGLVSIDEEQGEFYRLFVVYDEESVIEEMDTDDSTSLKARAVISMFSKVLETIEYPNIIRFDRSLSEQPAPAPSIDHLVENGTMDVNMGVQYSSEIEYKNLDRNFSTYLMRYDGNIIPQFIEKELDEPESEDYWNVVDSGAFNMVWRKKQMSEMSEADIVCLNYISRQRFDPDYPSIGFYYVTGEQIDFDEPYVAQGYLGEICWYHSNKIFYTERGFSISFTCSKDEVTDDIYEDKFVEYVSGLGSFKTMEEDEREKTIRKVIWPMYKYDVNWEYASEYDIYNYAVDITYSLR